MKLFTTFAARAKRNRKLCVSVEALENKGFLSAMGTTVLSHAVATSMIPAEHAPRLQKHHVAKPDVHQLSYPQGYQLFFDVKNSSPYKVNVGVGNTQVQMEPGSKTTIAARSMNVYYDKGKTQMTISIAGCKYSNFVYIHYSKDGGYSWHGNVTIIRASPGIIRFKQP